MHQWLRLAEKVLRSNIGKLSHPYKLTYVLTKECHSRCVNCKIWRNPPENELTLDEVKKFAERSPFFSWIDFTGGEPTDREDFPEIVEAFLKFNRDLLLIHFPTNGLRPERIEAIARRIMGLSPPRLIVTVSIDGPPAVNDALRGIKGDFEQATETYRRLAKIPGLEVFVGMTLYPKNVSRIEETFTALQESIPHFSRNQLHVNIPHISEHYYQNASGERGVISTEKLSQPEFREQLLQAIDGLRKWRGMPLHKPFDWVEFLYQKKAINYLQSGKTPVDCAALMASCYLAQDGTVFPCLIWDQPLGNIRQTDYFLEPILRSPSADTLRTQIRAKSCPNCWTPCEAYPSLAANLL